MSEPKVEMTQEQCPCCGQSWLARWHVEPGAVAPEPGTLPFVCPQCEEQVKKRGAEGITILGPPDIPQALAEAIGQLGPAGALNVAAWVIGSLARVQLGEMEGLSRRLKPIHKQTEERLHGLTVQERLVLLYTELEHLQSWLQTTLQSGERKN